MTTPEQHHGPLPTEEEIAVTRIRRITQEATDPTSGECVEHWLKDSLQKWWMTHQLWIEDMDVRSAFCDAIDASLSHMPLPSELSRIVAATVGGLRRGGEGVRATARAVIVHLGLDPDATPRSLLIREWEDCAVGSSGEPDPELAGYMANLTRSTLRMIADPELFEEERSELIRTAVASLRSVANVRQNANDYWAAILMTIWEFADGDVARTARLHVAAEELQAIANERS